MISGCLSLVFTKKLISYLTSKALLDQPTERSNHSVPTPTGGGIALLGSIYITYSLYKAFFQIGFSELDVVLILSFFLAILSWKDDLDDLPILLRLAVHIGCAAIGSYFVPQLFGGYIPLFFEKILVIFGWVWFTNLFNFMDGIDGITGVEIFSISAAMYFFNPDPIYLIICGSVIGFLVYNWQPAKVFMGDVGSIPMGFLIGYFCLGFLAAEKTYSYSVAAILPAYYLFDATLTLLLRIFRKETFWKPHSKHFFQRAVRRGWSHRKTATLVLFLNAILIGLAYASNEFKDFEHTIVVFAYLLVGTFLLAFKSGVATNPRLKSLISVVHDLSAAFISVIISFYIRYGDSFRLENKNIWIGSSAFVVSSAIFILAFKTYKKSWRYVSVQDIFSYGKVTFLSSILSISIIFQYNRLEVFPRSILFINAFVYIVILVSSRLFYRVYAENEFNFSLFDKEKKKNTVLVCTSQDCSMIMKSLSVTMNDIRIVAIVSNDGHITDREIMGIRVFEGIQNIEKVISHLKKRRSYPAQILVSKNSLEATELSELLKNAIDKKVDVNLLPDISMNKPSWTKKIRPVNLEDLLTRKQNRLESRNLNEIFEGKKILITGAGGYVGSELSMQIASYNPDTIVLFESGEHSLYLIEQELKENFQNVKIKAVLGDVRNSKQLERCLSEHQIEMAFHTASIKQVPIAESNILEALEINVIGTRNLANSCLKCKVGMMILVSSSEAVTPSNVIGATKKLSEKYIESLSSKSTSTKFGSVRFGNILGSAGSVIPLFEKQIKEGGPLTVTHLEATRHFMSRKEAVELTLHSAGLIISGVDNLGSTFVLDMGNPVLIKDLAEQMIRLSGLVPHKDVKILYTGLREGEKLNKQLVSHKEIMSQTGVDGIFKTASQNIDLGDAVRIIESIQYVIENGSQEDGLQLLLDVVPELIPHYQDVSTKPRIHIVQSKGKSTFSEKPTQH